MWWHKGIQFECQGSGQCCTSHGEYGFVFMTLEDRQRMAKVLKLSTREFTKKHCAKTQGQFHLIEDPKNTDCRFLKNKRCTVYQGRPTQCRTWPFWPDALGAKTWSKEVKTFCPGVGKGKVWTREEIEVQLKDQIQSEKKLDQEQAAQLRS